jgi:putative two-component system response regulator
MDLDLRTSPILIVDDEETNLFLLQRILASAGYRDVVPFNDPREALDAFDPERFDLLITDLHMPHLSGLELIEAIMRTITPNAYFPIAMITADMNPDSEHRALSIGATDFIHKPFRSSQIYLRVHNLLHTRALHRALQHHNDRLEQMVRERTIELEAARLDILERLALAAEFRDHTTGLHTQRVGHVAALLADKIGMPQEQTELLRRAAPLHDVGKIGIPDQILLKPGRLSTDEFNTMKAHVSVGAQLLSQGRSKLIHMAELIALTHHERWDGSGYPNRLVGDQIPIVGQIVAVADVFDTLINERPYKPAWPLDDALAEMRRQRGRWFSPRMVDTLFEVLSDHPDLPKQLTQIDRQPTLTH